MDLPVPKHWQDFETIVRDAQSQRWNTSLAKNGRPGQKQDGVDIWGPDEIGRTIGIQCKRFKSPLDIKDVENEIAKAKNFKGRLSALFLATTTEHDAKLQEKVRLLSDRRVAQGEFAVSLLFWDEIVGSLLLNPEVFKSHYPQIHFPKSQMADKERLLAALELGYYGADIWAYLTLIFGEFGFMAQADPDEFFVILRVLERRAQQLLAPEDAAPILSSLKKLHIGCLRHQKKQSRWDREEIEAKRASSRIQKAVSLISMPESSILDIALQLGRIYHHAEEIPGIPIHRQMERDVRSILPKQSTASIARQFALARKQKPYMFGYKWAQRIYQLLDHELRFGL
jgi:hypothetical protein